MITYGKCYKCFERQTRDVCAMSGIDEDGTEEILKRIHKKVAEYPETKPPVEMAVVIHDMACEASANPDPYADIKRHSNEVCSRFMPVAEEFMSSSKTPLETAIKLSIAGNFIDFGAFSEVDLGEDGMAVAVERTLACDLIGGTAEDLENLVTKSTKILFVGDNAGECFFDRFLLKLLPADRTVYAVRGGPILNDATMDDARIAGIHEVCRVMDTGHNAPGVLIDHCSEAFVREFEASDLVIAKGQGNYESMSGRDDRTYAFLLKVKCDVIAGDIGLPVGSNVVRICLGKSDQDER